jgi:hypothetical protein
LRYVGQGRSIWDQGWAGSWSALQTLASSVLGDTGEEGSHDAVVTGTTTGLKTRTQANSSKKQSSAWGPAGLPNKHDSGRNPESSANRAAALRTLKTASVLESRDDAANAVDSNGNFKRRTSLDHQTFHQQDEGTLVYVHHIKSQDTQAGLALKYHCQPTAFRAANRLWPNDSIQARKVVFLPVDACAIKGKPCRAPSGGEAVDLLAPTPGTEDPPIISTISANGVWQHSSQTSSPSNDTRNEASSQAEVEPPWEHVRWVLLESSPTSKPTEIVRLPRSTLGYFPPRRKKSQGALTPFASPRLSTDLRSSADLSRGGFLSPTESSQTSRAELVAGSYFPAPGPDLSSQSSGPNLPPRWMRGAGGVGTLKVRKPGPAEDSLNNWAARHFPSLDVKHLPSSSAAASDTVSYGFDDELASIGAEQQTFTRSSESAAHSHNMSGSGMGLEQAAAAVEGWIRKLATKASAPGTPKLGARLGAHVPQEIGEGDLIELHDGPGSDDGRDSSALMQDISRSVAASTARNEPASVARSRRHSKGKSE